MKENGKGETLRYGERYPKGCSKMIPNLKEKTKGDHMMYSSSNKMVMRIWSKNAKLGMGEEYEG